MEDKDPYGFQIIMNMLINKNQKDYLIIIASNNTRDFAVILIQQSSYIYFSKYNLDDFKKINFFKNYLNFGLSQCIEIMINLFKEKKSLLNIEEENNQIKLSLDIEISVVGMSLNLPKERIELILVNDSVDQILKDNLIWNSALYLFQEKEDDQKIKLEQENKIRELTQEITALKQNMDEKKFTKYIFGDYSYENDLIKSKIIKESNLSDFEFVKRRLKLFNKDKTLNFKMLYSAKINGDKSQKFHEFCDNHHNTLLIIKTTKGIIFGGFAAKTWNSYELGRKKDMKSFLFSINNKKIYNPKPSKYHLFCSDNDGPCFYAFSIENLFFQKEVGGFCDEIYKCNFDSFENDYELNNREKTFKIDELEMFEIKFV